MTQLNLSDDDVVRLLHSLSCAKYKILNKEPNTKTISPTDHFEFNSKFTDKMRRIKVLEPFLIVLVLSLLQNYRCFWILYVACSMHRFLSLLWMRKRRLLKMLIRTDDMPLMPQLCALWKVGKFWGTNNWYWSVSSSWAACSRFIIHFSLFSLFFFCVCVWILCISQFDHIGSEWNVNFAAWFQGNQKEDWGSYHSRLSREGQI